MSDPSRRRSKPSIWMKIWRGVVYLCYDLRDSVNLLGDGLPSESAPVRRQRRTLSLPIRIAMGLVRLPKTCVRLAVWLVRRSARFGRQVRCWLVYGLHGLLDLCYVVGLSPVSDSIDTRRIWSAKTALGVLPIVVFALVATVLGARIAMMDSRKLPAAYAAAGREALGQKDNPAASVYLQRLIELDPRNAPAVYELALSVDAEGDVQRAAALMTWLAPPGHHGPWPAHLWQAERLLQGPVVPSQDLATAEAHLRRTLHQQPDNQTAHRLLAKLTLNRGELSESEFHLAKAVEAAPELWLLLSRVRASTGKQAQASEDARQAVIYLQSQLQAEPGNSSLRLQLAEALWRSGDFSAAEKLLLAGRDGPQAEAFRSALANFYVIWSQAAEVAVDADRRHALLEQALQCEAWNLAALKRLVACADENAGDAAWVSQLLTGLDWAKAPANAHLTVGAYDWAHDRTSEAREHFEMAYRLEPTRIESANNLAWVLSHAEPKKLDRALRLVDVALKEAPTDPKVRASLLDTRGRILIMLERWDAALSDLESAAAIRTDDSKLHLALANCYDNLNMPELAKYRRQLAKAAADSSGDDQDAPP